MTDPTTYQQVQNGISTGLQNQFDPQLRYLRNGRDLGAYTHVDVLFQAYFIAFLVLNTVGAPAIPAIPTSAPPSRTASAPSVVPMSRPRSRPPLASR